jgi:hypothetical protein
MSQSVIIQQVYPDQGMERFLDLTRDRHAEYARMHDFDYRPFVSYVRQDWDLANGCWAKLPLIKTALRGGAEQVIWIDADAVIADPDVDLRDGCPEDGIGAVQFAVKRVHWNAGVLYFGNGPKVRDFVDRWLTKANTPNEQIVLNSIGKDFVTTLPCRWNYTYQRHFEKVEPIIYAFHGYGILPDRYERMKEWLEKNERVSAVSQ